MLFLEGNARIEFCSNGRDTMVILELAPTLFKAHLEIGSPGKIIIMEGQIIKVLYNNCKLRN